jgi:hypothetical protein
VVGRGSEPSPRSSVWRWNHCSSSSSASKPPSMMARSSGGARLWTRSTKARKWATNSLSCRQETPSGNSLRRTCQAWILLRLTCSSQVLNCPSVKVPCRSLQQRSRGCAEHRDEGQKGPKRASPTLSPALTLARKGDEGWHVATNRRVPLGRCPSWERPDLRGAGRARRGIWVSYPSVSPGLMCSGPDD